MAIKGTIRTTKKKNGKYNAKLTFGNKKNATVITTGEYCHKKDALRRVKNIATALVNDIVIE